MRKAGSFIRRRVIDQSGQVAVLVALLSVAMFSSLALVIDVGAGYASRRVMQGGVDAAALAAAQDIVEGRGEAAARATASTYVAQNLSRSPGRVDVSFPDASRVRVDVTDAQQTFFARLFGRRSFPVTAKATAAIGVADEVENLVPIIVPHQSVAGHIGASNQAVYELGDDRPLDNPSITYVQVGNRVTYTLSYSNTCDHVAVLDISSPIPAGSSYVSGSATAGGALSGGSVRWLFNNVAPGDRRSADFAVDFSGHVDPQNEVIVNVSGPKMAKRLTGSTTNSQRGFFWLVDFDGISHPTGDFADWIVNGYPEPVGVGSLANGTGMRAALKAAVAQRAAADSKVVLPLYDYTEGGGSNGSYHVVGFAEFVITGFDLNGNPKSVTGYFTNGTVTAGAHGNGGAMDFGVKTVWLSD